MADVASKVAQIRQAVYGKDVRESIASGIEAINSEVINTTSRQNAIEANEQTRINNEKIRNDNEVIRDNNEKLRFSTFESNERNRIATFEQNEAARQHDAKIMKDTFDINENYRVKTFDVNEQNRTNIFEYNETARQQDMKTFMQWYNDSQTLIRLPVVIDGGNFTDTETDKIYDGGDF